jgi:hypothetical protein
VPPGQGAAAPGALGGAAARDTLDAVFRLPAFSRPLRETFWGWVGSAVGRLWQVLGGARAAATPALFWTVAAAAAVLLVYAVARAASRREGGRRGPARAAAGGAADPRRAAASAAAAGDFAAAAHHLYAAVLAALGARALVRLHPSKTAGDYARELRAPARGVARGAAPAERALAAGAYGAFARGYEAVVYGPRAPDQARYAALAAAAAPLLDPAPPSPAPGRAAAPARPAA